MKYNFNDETTAKSIRELPLDERPRERLKSYGASSLSDLELICILLGSGTRTRPVHVLSRDLQGMLDRSDGKTALSTEEICKIDGMGDAKASIISAALELGRRHCFISHKTVKSASDVYPLIRHYGDRDQEYFICVSLNGAHEVIATRVVTIGLVNRTLVHPREVFSDPLKERSSAVIVAHNHPSQNLTPSAEDLNVTRDLIQAGRIVGIRVLDHIVFSSEGFFSFSETGCMPVV